MQALSSLLNPVSVASPGGEDLSFSAELDAIAEARRFDDPTLDQGEWVTDLKEANWGQVAERCQVLLATRSKDLRLAVWLAEAGAKTQQFRGLGDGYNLIAGLCDSFWETLHPLADDADQERRIGNLSWLLARSRQLIREIPITEGVGTAFSISDFDAARSRAGNADRPGTDGSKSEGGPKLAVIEAARRKSSPAFYQALLVQSQYCLDALLRMEKAVDARLGIDGPGFSAAKEAMDTAMRLIARFAADVGIRPTAATAGSEVDAATDAIPKIMHGTHAVASGRLESRAQALAQLRAVAKFFRDTEPHSPVAYLAEKAANWGDLPLHAWLRTVIKDGASLKHVEELLGLQSTPTPE